MAVLEVWGPGRHDVAVLGGSRYSIGKHGDADLSIATDAAVSGMHVLLERAGAVWCVRDLGSRNGTFVNGERLFGERVLRDGDEIIVGRTRLVFRDEASGDASTTEALRSAPGVDAAGAGRAGGVVPTVVVGQRVHAAGVGARDRRGVGGERGGGEAAFGPAVREVRRGRRRRRATAGAVGERGVAARRGVDERSTQWWTVVTGEVLADRYEVVATVSRGAQASVLRAIDRRHDRAVALKVYQCAEGVQREALLAEARVLLGLSPHPGLPTVRDDFFVDARYVVVMDWVEGDGPRPSARRARRAGPGPVWWSWTVCRRLRPGSITFMAMIHRWSTAT